MLTVLYIHEGANIINKREVEVTPDQPLDYYWEGHGITVHIPAGAITRPATLCIQASLSGDYQLPDDGVLVSGVYWLSLHPHVKKFNKQVTVTIQHCACEDDSTLSFITAKCTQDAPPYFFQQLPGGKFSDYNMGSIKMDHFCAIGINGAGRHYTFRTYYLHQKPNLYEAHITATQDLELQLQVRFSSYYKTRYNH